MKVKDIKQKVAAKVAKGKAKVAAKCGKGRKCAALAALLALAVAGCHMGEQPTAQRAQTSTIRDNVITVTIVMPTNAVAEKAENPAIHVEVGNLAQANETSGTETLTAAPSNTPTVSTPVQVDARYNDAIAAATPASKAVLDAVGEGADAVLGLMKSGGSGKVDVVKKDGTAAAVECKDGQCSFCADCELAK